MRDPSIQVTVSKQDRTEISYAYHAKTPATTCRQSNDSANPSSDTGGISRSMIGGIQRNGKGYVGDVDRRIMW
jgi:hypothetical protein